MEPDARRHLDLLAASIDIRREPRDEGRFERMVPAARPAWQAGRHVAASHVLRRDPEPGPTRARAPLALKRALLVDTDMTGVAAVEAALRLVAHVEVCTDFRTARARLLQHPPDLLITNLRLEAYNGLHLVLLAATTRTRCIVFSSHQDIGMARQIQAAGAFFEFPLRLPQVIESYVSASLPQRDRRDIAKLEQGLPGGRRCTDR